MNELKARAPLSQAIRSLLQQAVALHQSGRLAEARALYERILAEQPRQFDSLHFLGVIALQSGEAEKSVQLIGEALRVNPHSAAACFNRGNALQSLGRLDEALSSYDRALALRSDDAEAHNNRGVTLQGLQRFAEALAGYDRALSLNPGFAEAHKNRGRVLTLLKRPAEALTSYERALSLRADDAEAWNSHGILLKNLQRPEEALSSYDRALALAPDRPETHNNRGAALSELGRPDEALTCYDRALALRPDDATSWYNRGNALRELGRPEEALASYDRALALRPGYVEAHNNRGNALRLLKRLDEALASFDTALALRPDADIHTNRGNALKDLGRLDEAVASYDRAIALEPGHADSHWNKAFALLLQGDFERGLPLYEWRWESGETRKFKRGFAQPLWLGIEPLAGKTILLQAEQGLGDSIQFCRYAPLVHGRGARVLLAVPRPLLRLLGELEGVSELVDKGERLPAFDCYCPLLSLPLAFGTRLDTIPTPDAYLKPEADKVEAWRERLGPQIKPRIGVVWSSTSKFENDANRSMEFRRFIEAIPPGTFDVVCLQKEIKASDIGDFQRHGEVRFFGGLLTDFAETAALASCMDVVVSTCTSVPHLTAALGIPTWLVLARIPDWRWMLGRDNSPWYRAAKLYRQGEDRAWEPVLQRVAGDLLKRVGRY